MSLYVNSEPLTPEKIIQTLHELDMIVRPKALILSPQVKKVVLEAYPQIEERILLVENPACEDGTAYLIDRSKLEEFTPTLSDYDTTIS